MNYSEIAENEYLVDECSPDDEDVSSDCELNQAIRMECTEEKCRNGTRCENRRFQQRRWKKMRVQQTKSKGAGLFAMERLEKDDFVVEYVGQVVSEEDAQKRTSMYMVKMKGGLVIDANVKGNKARFINHSCDPNLVAIQWSIQGHQRLGLFARKKIEKHEEMTFDYKFESFGEATSCACGSTNCRGTMDDKTPSSQTQRGQTKKRGWISWTPIDPKAPPKPRTGYFIFREDYRIMYGRNTLRRTSLQAWGRLTNNERALYKEEAVEERKQYEEAWSKYVQTQSYQEHMLKMKQRTEEHEMECKRRCKRRRTK